MSSLIAATDTNSNLSSIDVTSLTFVQDDNKYRCVECHQWLRQPHQTPCGHRMCKQCVDSVFNKSKKSTVLCPAKEEDCIQLTREMVNPDYSAAREMRKLRVYCLNRENGCDVTPVYEKLQEHIDCCEFGLKSCPHCQQRVNNKQLQSHIDVECQQVVEHCSYNCGIAALPRCKLSGHLKHCTNKPHKCQYNKLGCRFKGLKSELEAHENTSTNDHLQLAVSYIQQLTVDFHSKQTKLQTDVDSLKSDLLKYKDDNLQLISTIKQLQCTQQISQEQQTGLSTKLDTHVDKCNKLLAQELHVQTILRKQTDQEQRIKQLLQQQQQQTVSLPDDVCKQFDRTITQQEVRLSEIDLRCQCLETTNYDGVLIWKIGDYTERKRQATEGRILSLYSQPFYTSRYGYKLCARVYLNGDGAGRGSHLSLFFVVMQGDYDDLLTWPFRQRVTFTLLDQRTNKRHLSDTFRPDLSSASFQKPSSTMNVASGCPLFVPHSTLEDTSEALYLRNNYVYIKVAVDTSDLFNP